MVMNRLLLLVLLIVLAFNLQALTPTDFHRIKSNLYMQYQVSKSRILDSPLGIPVSLVSSIQDNVLRGEIIGIIDHPFAVTRNLLDDPADWCEVLILHINTKACTFANSHAGKVHLYAGRKYYQAPTQATRLILSFNRLASQNDLLAVKLYSPTGPFATRDYLIEFETIPLLATGSNLATSKTLFRMTFSYRLSWLAQNSIRIYLATLARNKVGFSVTDVKQGMPVFIKGIQGIIERNTMRNFLALETVLKVPKDSQDALKRARYWHKATEQFQHQLHEIEKDKYLANKAREIENQRLLQLDIDKSNPEN